MEACVFYCLRRQITKGGDKTQVITRERSISLVEHFQRTDDLPFHSQRHAHEGTRLVATDLVNTPEPSWIGHDISNQDRAPVRNRLTHNTLPWLQPQTLDCIISTTDCQLKSDEASLAIDEGQRCGLNVQKLVDLGKRGGKNLLWIKTGAQRSTCGLQ